MRWTDDITIETPEQIDVSLETAGLGSRFVARVVDWVIKWGILLLASILVFIIVALVGAALPTALSAQIYLLSLLVTMYYAFLLAYDIYYETRHHGQTPGKRAAGIRVLREGGAAVDFRTACVRNLLGLADFLPVFYLLGGLIALLTARTQRLGDLAAGTIVIRKRALAPPADLDRQVESLASDQFTFTPDQLSACGPADRHILRSFFQRYEAMQPQARWELARRLAEVFAAKVGRSVGNVELLNSQAEVFLACLFRDVQNWERHQR